MSRKIPEVISEQELLKILDVETKPKLKFAYALGFYEAMRISEVVNLQKENIDRGQRLLLIKQSKNNKDRNIPISPKILKGLKHIPIGKSIRTLQRRFKEAGLKAIGKDLHFHQLRHSGISHYLNKENWDIRQLQRLAGHSKISTTEIYTHVSPEDLVNKMWDSSSKATK